MTSESASRIHPMDLMQAIQTCVIDETDAPLLAESGNSFAWANAVLCFPRWGRYRTSMLFGSLGHACAGVLGAATLHGKAVALTGDGAMLFANEVSTAVAHAVRAVWIVMNDAAYGSCVHGQRARGLSTHALAIPRVDFAEYARSLGACGISVRQPDGLTPALRRAMRESRPSVVDVHVRSEPSPLAQRFESFFGADVASARGEPR